MEMNIDKLERWVGMGEIEVWRFISWQETDFLDNNFPHKKITATALAQKYDNGSYYWFERAINTMRDGDMGKKGEDGVYERSWAADSVSSNYDIRPSTAEEVILWMKHCGVPESTYPNSTLLELHVEDGNSYAIFSIPSCHH